MIMTQSEGRRSDGHRRLEATPRQVVIAGSSTLLVDALAAALAISPGIETQRTAAKGTELLQRMTVHPPDVVVICVAQLDLATIRLVGQLREDVPLLRTIVVTERPTARDLKDAYNGEVVCLSLEAGLGHLVRAIDNGSGDVGPVEDPARGRRETQLVLTRRECQVLGMLADGQSPAAIAGRLAISVYTARGHVKKVLRKLGAHTQLEAVAVARRLGILGGPEANVRQIREEF